MSREIAQHEREVVGVDIAGEVIATNSEAQIPANLSFVACDLLHLDRLFAEQTFTKIVCVDVLEHVNEVQGVVRTLSTLLAVGGLACFLVPLDPPHGHFPYSVAAFEDLLNDSRLQPTQFESISPGFATRLVMQWHRKATCGFCGGPSNVDSFERTRAFRLAQERPVLLRAYGAAVLPWIRLATRLDPEPYVRGRSALLAVARKRG